MFDEPLPPDLRQVEQEVIFLMRFNPPAEIGHRIIGVMREELRRERVAARWKFALGLAAGAFLWLHLSFYVAPVTDFHFRGAAAVPINLPAAGPEAIFPHWSCGEPRHPEAPR